MPHSAIFALFILHCLQMISPRSSYHLEPKSSDLGKIAFAHFHLMTISVNKNIKNLFNTLDHGTIMVKMTKHFLLQSDLAPCPFS